MLITHSFIGVVRGNHRILFFLIFQDYIDAERRFVQELEPHLERFARNLGTSGALVRPFTGDIEMVRAQVLGKEWTQAERQQIAQTPAILMIDQDFAAFNPREHSWFHIRLGRSLGEEGDVQSIATWLEAMADAATQSKADPFKTAGQLQHEVTLDDAKKVFEAKPGVFGFSVDLVAGAGFLAKLVQQWRAAA